jgi:hypothetical protein
MYQQILAPPNIQFHENPFTEISIAKYTPPQEKTIMAEGISKSGCSCSCASCQKLNGEKNTKYTH